MRLRPRPRDERTDEVMARVNVEVERLKRAIAELRAEVGNHA